MSLRKCEEAGIQTLRKKNNSRQKKIIEGARLKVKEKRKRSIEQFTCQSERRDFYVALSTPWSLVRII